MPSAKVAVTKKKMKIQLQWMDTSMPKKRPILIVPIKGDSSRRWRGSAYYALEPARSRDKRRAGSFDSALLFSLRRTLVLEVVLQELADLGHLVGLPATPDRTVVEGVELGRGLSLVLFRDVGLTQLRPDRLESRHLALYRGGALNPVADVLMVLRVEDEDGDGLELTPLEE